MTVKTIQGDKLAHIIGLDFVIFLFYVRERDIESCQFSNFIPFLFL